jgi:transposase
LTHLPSEEEEAVRDLLRSRAQVGADLKRAKNRAVNFLRRRGHVYRLGKSLWTLEFLDWANAIKLESRADRMTLVSHLAIVGFLKKRVQEKDQQFAEFAVSEPYKEPVRYLRGGASAE